MNESVRPTMDSPPGASPEHESSPRRQRRVLVVDDDEALSSLFSKALRADDFAVESARNGREAGELLESRSFDVIVSDISMPEMNGIELLKMIRKHDLDVPVVLVTGQADVASAARAVEYGAFRFLEKPVSTTVLREVVGRAVQLHELARIKRRAMLLLREHASVASDRAGLMSAFSDALATLRMHYQPIVKRSTRKVIGYEALVRSSHPMFPNPGALIDAGERLGRMHELGRVIRERVASGLPSVPEDQLVFVNLHPREMADEKLLSPEAPLSLHASRVVLEVTERVQLDEVDDLDGRITALRSLGYRLALDDLGAGYAGLQSFIQLNPDFVKIDMSLTRGLDQSEPKRALVRSALQLCGEMSVLSVVEGVETKEELRALAGIGADLLQGYLFGRPAENPATVDPEAFEG